MTTVSPKIKDTEPIKTKDKDIPEKFKYFKNRVALVKLDTYQPKAISAALEKIIKLLDLEKLIKNKSIFFPFIISNNDICFD